jgi:hypothetical protein
MYPFVPGKFSNYQFDKTKFLQDMKSIPSGTPVSWTELARKYQVRNAQGNAPGNAGQVLFQFARQNGICFVKLIVGEFPDTDFRLSALSFFISEAFLNNGLCN